MCSRRKCYHYVLHNKLLVQTSTNKYFFQLDVCEFVFSINLWYSYTAMSLLSISPYAQGSPQTHFYVYIFVNTCVSSWKKINKISGLITSFLCQVSTKHPFHTHNSVHTSFVSSVTRLVSRKKQVLLPGAR